MTGFVYVIYIRATQQKVWDALTGPEFQRQYWFGSSCESEWTVGSTWTLKMPDGRVADTGEIIEAHPPRRLVIKWRNEFRPDLKAEGFSRCIMEIVQQGKFCRLTVDHSNPIPQSKFIEAVSGGWPKILSSLKSLLETGTGLPRSDEWPMP